MRRAGASRSVHWRFESRWRLAPAADAGRYAGMRHFAVVGLLGLLSLLLLGCPARWNVVFINGTDQQLMMKLAGGLDDSQRSFGLPPGRSHSELLQHVSGVTVSDENGAKLFQRDDFGLRDLAPGVPSKYPNIYVLVTATNAYPIPPNYRSTWREHIDEITRRK
jgi:hypothetical protein